MAVGARFVERIEAMKADNVETQLWDSGLVVNADKVHVFVVSPRHEQIIETAISFVHAMDCVVPATVTLVEVKLIHTTDV